MVRLSWLPEKQHAQPQRLGLGLLISGTLKQGES